MRTKRINTDIYDSLALKNSSDGSALDLTDAYDMHLYLRRDGSSDMLEQVFTITDNKIYYQYNSKENNALGVYNLHFYYKKNNANSENGYDQYHFDVSRIFKIVKSSAEENWAGGITGVISRHCQTISERQAVLQHLAEQKSELTKYAEVMLAEQKAAPSSDPAPDASAQ